MVLSVIFCPVIFRSSPYLPVVLLKTAPGFKFSFFRLAVSGREKLDRTNQGTELEKNQFAL
jgi:hypothetical protein